MLVINSRFLLFPLIFFIISCPIKILADSPVSVVGSSLTPRTEIPRLRLPSCGSLFTNGSVNADALCGESKDGNGVSGFSMSKYGILGIGEDAGVFGSSSSATGAGIFGINNGLGNGVVGVNNNSGTAAAHFYNNATDGDHLWLGYPLPNFVVAHDGGLSVRSNSANSPSAMFTNLNPQGDYIWAGNASDPVFKVKHNGSIFVRGQEAPQKGEKGEKGGKGLKGFKGEVGSIGPITKSFAVCGATCECRNDMELIVVQHIPSSGGSCSVTADRGTCSTNAPGGHCCLCAPK